MKFVESLCRHRAAGQALLATNFYNFETLLAVLRAAQRCRCELILQTSPSTIQYLGGVTTAVGMARAAARQEGVTAWLHLDHAADPPLIQQCIEAGYDSVMIDASEKDYPANVRLSRQVVALAHPRQVAVEAELGYIPKLGQRDADARGYTDPQQAAEFVAATGIDLLAVAIGTAHGFYKRTPRLDLDRLLAIRAATDVPLVLHGGSGLPQEIWRQVRTRGITKINFATEIKDTFIRALKTQMFAGDEIDLRKVCPPAIAAVTNLVSDKLHWCGFPVDAPAGKTGPDHP